MESLPPKEKEKFEPIYDLKKAMEELSIDWKAENFNPESTRQMFVTISQDNKISPHDRDRFKHLATVMGKHKFWETQPIMKPTEGTKKEGLIKQYSPEEIN